MKAYKSCELRLIGEVTGGENLVPSEASGWSFGTRPVVTEKRSLKVALAHFSLSWIDQPMTGSEEERRSFLPSQEVLELALAGFRTNQRLDSPTGTMALDVSGERSCKPPRAELCAGVIRMMWSKKSSLPRPL
jgi:hypothetical protein